ncbi:MAG: hypothetical protein A2091_11225 [Desulfuromonadales bacterium GWD2_61_12]|nr:MAG: hypothetical protein A2091_11225 [Desulfuromonadales bacterium GWD2_61_12]
MSDLLDTTLPCTSRNHPCPGIKMLIEPQERDLGGFAVRRLLPNAQFRSVGPFVFFDHLGPAELPPRHWHRRQAPPAHRPGDGDLPLRRRAAAPRQPRTKATRLVVIGGAPLGKRTVWWNFVASRRERIEKAKADWQAGRFPPIPDETEGATLPE